MSALAPYRRPPRQRHAAMVVSPHYMVDEDGVRRRLKPDPNLTIYGSWERIEPWWLRGQGELFQWEGKRVRWRQDETDVYLLPGVPEDAGEAWETGVALWAQWARFHGGSPRSLGQTAVSLYRANSSDLIYPYRRNVPKLVVIGARTGQAVPPGPLTGPLEQWDLPAAYASELGRMQWGGTWTTHVRPGADFDRLSAAGMPIFAHATVRTPRGVLGPLPRRPRREMTVWEQVLRPIRDEVYPAGRRLRGVWTWDELRVARESGASVKVDRVWLHAVPAERTPFADWWRVISEGRSFSPHYMGTLAKATGNAMYGQLIIRHGQMSRITMDPRHGRRIEKLPRRGGHQPRHIHLAETITGRTRARLYTALRAAGESAVAWHTDGFWRYADVPMEFEGWRRKRHAERMDLLYPDCYAFTEDGTRTEYVVSGVPERMVERSFEELWQTLRPEEPRTTGVGNMTRPHLRTA